MQRLTYSLIFICGVLMMADCTAAVHKLVEAQSFEYPGGWVIDTQAKDQMGSAYLLAHGMGVPVEDAVTEVILPEPGSYRVLVRTRDWVWPHAPGQFKLVVNGIELETIFGTATPEWDWQQGPTIDVVDTNITLALRDLTGFGARCDAVLFVKGDEFQPPNERDALARFRQESLGLLQPIEAGEYDFVVIGGGLAGVSAAVAAARLDLKVALIQNRPVLGGNFSSEIRVGLLGETDKGPFPRNADIVNELEGKRPSKADTADLRGDQRLPAIVLAEPNINLFLKTHVYAVEMEGDRIAAVIGRNIVTSEALRFRAPLFADCTGDANVGHMAGADYRYGRESREETGESLAPEQADDRTLGSTNLWRAVRAETPSAFPAELPWAIRFNEETVRRTTRGDWSWESGFSRHTINEAEFIRDYNWRVIYGNWSYLKNHAAGKEEYANFRLNWVAYIAGKRESRRLMGDVILRQQDILDRVEYDDACVTTTWQIDLHYSCPDNSKHFPGEEFVARFNFTHFEPYTFPYRCLYSRNVPNLMMAGRNISVTHVAHGSIRVMRTTAMMGAVIGRAAYICRIRNTTPRGVYENYLQEFLDLLANPDR